MFRFRTFAIRAFGVASLFAATSSYCIALPNSDKQSKGGNRLAQSTTHSSPGKGQVSQSQAQPVTASRPSSNQSATKNTTNKTTVKSLGIGDLLKGGAAPAAGSNVSSAIGGEAKVNQSPGSIFSNAMNAPSATTVPAKSSGSLGNVFGSVGKALNPPLGTGIDKVSKGLPTSPKKAPNLGDLVNKTGSVSATSSNSDISPGSKKVPPISSSTGVDTQGNPKKPTTPSPSNGGNGKPDPSKGTDTCNPTKPNKVPDDWTPHGPYKQPGNNLYVPKNGNGGFVPPWLQKPANSNYSTVYSKTCGDTNYCRTHGCKESWGISYPGYQHSHWYCRSWSSVNGCWFFYDRGCSSWYYWCAPDSCYYPCTYKPYETFTCSTAKATGSVEGSANATSGGEVRLELPPLPGE